MTFTYFHEGVSGHNQKHKLGSKLIFAPKLGQKPIWVPLFSFKIFVSLVMPKLGILVPTLIDFVDNFIVSLSLFMGED